MTNRRRKSEKHISLGGFGYNVAILIQIQKKSSVFGNILIETGTKIQLKSN
jgi:hypothetical protein